MMLPDVPADIPWRQMGMCFVATAVSVFLKGIQHKNIEGNHIKLIFYTSYLMACADMFVIGLIVKNGMWMVIPSATGSSLGMITAMKAHRKLVKPKDV